MEKNIFEGAKFGDKFVMRNGKIAIYHMKDKLYANNSHLLINEQDIQPFSVDNSGKMSHIKTEHYFDIISRYQEPTSRKTEPIDEDKLDELAYKETKYSSISGGWHAGFKAGYKKAMEE